MKFHKTVQMAASLDEVWAFTDDLKSLAQCIPGIDDIELHSAEEFDATLTQRVGPTTAQFELRTRLQDLNPKRSVSVITQGVDPNLASQLTAHLRFDLHPSENGTRIEIDADVRLTGQIAAFGQRIIPQKADEVIVKTLENLSLIVAERRS